MATPRVLLTATLVSLVAGLVSAVPYGFRWEAMPDARLGAGVDPLQGMDEADVQALRMPRDLALAGAELNEELGSRAHRMLTTELEESDMRQQIRTPRGVQMEDTPSPSGWMYSGYTNLHRRRRSLPSEDSTRPLIRVPREVNGLEMFETDSWFEPEAEYVRSPRSTWELPVEPAPAICGCGVDHGAEVTRDARSPDEALPPLTVEKKLDDEAPVDVDGKVLLEDLVISTDSPTETSGDSYSAGALFVEGGSMKPAGKVVKPAEIDVEGGLYGNAGLLLDDNDTLLDDVQDDRDVIIGDVVPAKEAEDPKIAAPTEKLIPTAPTKQVDITKSASTESHIKKISAKKVEKKKEVTEVKEVKSPKESSEEKEENATCAAELGKAKDVAEKSAATPLLEKKVEEPKKDVAKKP